MLDAALTLLADSEAKTSGVQKRHSRTESE
jgi:hypothetical protein